MTFHKKPIRKAKENCSPVSSNCVVWQGPDIPFLDLCHGDSVTEVVFELATKVQEIITSLDPESYDLKCFDSECPPASFEELLQAMIDRSCDCDCEEKESGSAYEFITFLSEFNEWQIPTSGFSGWQVGQAGYENLKHTVVKPGLYKLTTEFWITPEAEVEGIEFIQVGVRVGTVNPTPAALQTMIGANRMPKSITFVAQVNSPSEITIVFNTIGSSLTWLIDGARVLIEKIG
jgi:hypothetical protein